MLAHSPALRAGLLGSDYADLLGERGAGFVVAAWTRLSLIWRGLPVPGESGFWLRLEQLACLIAIALTLRAFLARLLAPWVGPEAGRAAALAAAIFVPLHPLAVEFVAEVGARAEIAGVGLALLGGALFMKGRQERQEPWTVSSMALLFLAGTASFVAVLVGCAIAMAEYSSVRRTRERVLRLRTTATSAAFLCASAWIGQVLGARDHAPREALGQLGPDLQDLGRILGLLVWPVGQGLGALGICLAGALFVLAFRPAFRVSRHAPRLWGGILTVWGAWLVASLAWASLGGAGSSLLALCVWATGLGLAASALRAGRRAYHVSALVVGFAVLAHSGARPLAGGARVQAELRSEVLALGLDERAPIVVLDPPAGTWDARLWREFGWMLHPALGGQGVPSRAEGFDPERMRTASSEAFLLWTEAEAFAAARARGLSVVIRDERTAGLRSVRLGPADEAAARALVWRGDLDYRPEALLDPLGWEQVRVVAGLSSAAREFEALAWVAESGEIGRVQGLVSEQQGRRVATYELSGSLAWRLAGRVRSLQVEKGVRAIERGELHALLPELGGCGPPRGERDDWVFSPPKPGLPLQEGGSFLLRVLRLPDLALRTFPLEPDAGGTLRARGAGRFSRAALEGGASLCWSLDYRVARSVLLRARGQLPE